MLQKYLGIEGHYKQIPSFIDKTLLLNLKCNATILLQLINHRIRDEVNLLEISSPYDQLIMVCKWLEILGVNYLQNTRCQKEIFYVTYWPDIFLYRENCAPRIVSNVKFELEVILETKRASTNEIHVLVNDCKNDNLLFPLKVENVSSWFVVTSTSALFDWQNVPLVHILLWDDVTGICIEL